MEARLALANGSRLRFDGGGRDTLQELGVQTPDDLEQGGVAAQRVAGRRLRQVGDEIALRSAGPAGRGRSLGLAASQENECEK
jgi:hypothetical protein